MSSSWFWNGAHVIGRAIASVVGQDLPAGDWSIQVLVVDDGSTDDLAGALRQFGAQVSCIRHARNAGAAAARNTGIRAAKCDYLAFPDSDDVWLPNKLANQIAFMRSGGPRRQLHGMQIGMRAGLASSQPYSALKSPAKR
jgi:glycosyltransferase involved in cell wall biosynthesis